MERLKSDETFRIFSLGICLTIAGVKNHRQGFPIAPTVVSNPVGGLT